MNRPLKDGQDGYKIYDGNAQDVLEFIKEHTDHEWIGGLSEKERTGITYFTSGYYEEINDYLRNGKSPRLKKVREKVERCIAGAETGLDRYEIKEPTVFHRGGSLKLLYGNNEMGKTVKDIRAMIGKVVTDQGFVSATPRETEGYCGIKEPGEATFHIQTPAGKGIGAYTAPISSYGSENEFTYNRGSSFVITGAYEKNGEIHVNMMYVGKNRKKL